MKKKNNVQIFKLEERVLFDGAAAAEIVAAVDNAANQNQDQDQNSEQSGQDKEQELIRNTVQNAGPVDTPAPDATVQNAGEGLPQADAARNDPADVLINGSADFTQVTDPNAGFSGDVADFIQAADPDAEADAASHELIVIDSDAADQFDQDAFEGKNVLFLDSDADAADQIEDWLDDHSGQDINEVRLVTDSDTLASQISDIDVDVVTVDAFQSELADADSSDLVIVPDHQANITVDAPADELPEELSNDAPEGRHELVIVNSSMAELDNVLDQLGDSREVLVIDSTGDAFEQISDYLDNSDAAYDAVHILTHGNEDGFYLGSQKVIAADQMAVFSGHLTDNGDFMLYGCNLAASENGQALIHNIADCTGADVAASVNMTGAAALGGDWSLEYADGNIETAAVSLDSDWNFRLATITVDCNASESKTNFQTLTKALKSDDVVSGDTIEIKNVLDTDTGPDELVLNKSLTITLATGVEISYTWKLESLTLNGSLSISDITLSGGTIDVNSGNTLELLNAVNNVSVQLHGGSALYIGKETNVTSVVAESGADISFHDNGSVDSLTLQAGGGWILNKGTIGTLVNQANVTASGATFTSISNSGDLNLTAGSVANLNHTGTSLLIANKASVSQLNAWNDTTISGGNVTNASFSGGAITITGGTIITASADTNLEFSAGSINSLTQTSGNLTATGGTIMNLYNNSIGTNMINGAGVDMLQNTGSIEVVSGKIGSVNNLAGSITFKGGSISDLVTNAEGADIVINSDISSGKIVNEGTFELNAKLSIATGNGETAFINRSTGTLTFSNGTLSNSTPVNGIGLSNTAGGTVNATETTATIEGFTFATEIAGSEIDFSGDNTYKSLSSITVRGGQAADPEVETMQEAFDIVSGAVDEFYSITIDLALNEFSNWESYLTVSESYTLTNLFKISSTTMVNGSYVAQNVYLNGDLTLAPDVNGGTITMDNVSMTVNAGGSLTIPVEKNMLLTGTHPEVVSVSGESTPFPTATLKNSATNLVNNGTLTVEGTIKGQYNGLSSKLQSIVNNGTFNLAGQFVLLDLTTAGSGNLPDVDGIFNTGALTISDSRLESTFPAEVAAAALIRNSDTGSVVITDSTLKSDSSTGRNSFAIYNDGTLDITDSFIDASGSSSFGLFNGVNGKATFTVTQLPDIDLDSFKGITAGDGVLGEYASQIYHIKGGAYSVYNEGVFESVDQVAGETGGLFTGTFGPLVFRDAPVYALIGNFQTTAYADGASAANLTDITLVGSYTSYGTAKNYFSNLILNGNLSNTISEVYVAGAFMASDFTVGDGTNSFKGYYGTPGSHSDISIINFESDSEGSRKGGAVYFGQNAESLVSFNPGLDYNFYNLSGEMSFIYFGGLSSENNPVQLYNQGVMTIDGSKADGLIDGLYRLYVEEPDHAESAFLQFYDHSTAAGVSDRGIMNVYANYYNAASIIPNQMTLINLDIRNTQDASAAVTNYAGNLTINGGRLSSTYSGLDNMELHYGISKTDSLELYVITGTANLNNLTEIAGAAYSVRNNGELNITGSSDQDTLFTNQLEFGSNYSGGYTAVVNSAISVGVWERDSSENGVTTAVHYIWNSAFSSGSWSFQPGSQGSVLASSHLYSMTSATTTKRTEITLTLAGSYSSSESKFTDNYYNPATVFIGESTLEQVSFLAKSTPATNMVFLNWGKLTVTGINADNQFNGFNHMLDVSNSYHAFYDHIGGVGLTATDFTIESDLEVGFQISASTVKSETIPWKITMRGVKVDSDDPGSYLYEGAFIVSGSALSVSTNGELALVNFSVEAGNTANAIQVDVGGLLHIFNGTYDSETHQWIGGSNAVISSDGNANGIMLYGSMEMINGAITECVNGIVAEDTAGLLIVINSTIAGNSGWGILSSMSTPSESGKHNFFVANSTIAYNGGGIKMNSGRVLLLNDIILNRNTSGKDSVDVIGTVHSDSTGNIYGSSAADTDAKMKENFGSLTLTWTGPDMYTISLVEDSAAWTASKVWTYNSDSSSKFILSELVVGSGGEYQITYDKMGNNRTDPDGPIGSYVHSGSVGPTAILVTTLQDSDEIIVYKGNKLYSLRYVINYLLSTDNTGADTVVAFDWAKLYAEAEENPDLTITLDNTLGSLNVKYVEDTTPINTLTIDLIAEGYEIPSGYTLNIKGSGLTNSVFMVSGIALTVNGAGALTITGSGDTADNGAAFNLEDAEGTSLTLDNVTVTGGNTTGNGGAVYVGGANVSLTAAGVTFSGNTAAGNGGAIYNNGGTITVDGTLNGNTAAGNGGAIYNDGGTITVGGTLSGNSAVGNGGAVYNAGSASISASLTGNSAENGGGIYNTGTTLTVTGKLEGNTAAVNGGALYNAGTASISGDITDNSAENGGGIYSTGTALAVTGKLDGNTASGNGGALYNAGTAEINTNVTGNIAENGGGIYNIGNLTVTGNLDGNTASGNGGAFYNAGTAEINGNIINNQAENGAGVYSIAGEVKLNGDLTGNTADDEGAAVYVSGGTFDMIGNITDNTGASIIYADGGLVQIGDPAFSDQTRYITISDNTGITVKQDGGDILIVNASITGNEADGSTFEITDGMFTLLNSTVTGNAGDVLDQSGGTVQIADSTIYEPDGDITFTGTLNVLNSIVNVSDAVLPTNSRYSLIKGVDYTNPQEVFVWKSGEPVPGENGTLKIKASGLAVIGGAMVGYTRSTAQGTQLYYTTDGSDWYKADGTPASVSAVPVSNAQNGVERLYDGYGKLSIGAYSIVAAERSLVVTISGDESVEGETTLRDALEYAEYLYNTTGEIQTVTFLVDEVYLNSTITISSPVAVNGGGSVTVNAAELGQESPFEGDSVFVVNGLNDVLFKSITIRGKAGVRGIRVDDGSLVLKGTIIENGQADGTVPGSEAVGGAIYVKNGSVVGSNVTLKDNFAEIGAAIYANGPVSLDGFKVSGNYQLGTGGGVINVTDPTSTLMLRDGVLTGNETAGTLIETKGMAGLISVSAAENGLGSALVMADSADIVNSTLTGDPSNGAALVYITADLNVANSVIVTSRQNGPAALAGDIRSAYTIYSGFLENVSVDVGNLIGQSYGDVFDEGGGARPMPKEDSPAAVGVWTTYDPETREITYTERPEIWTKGYKPANMQWNVLGGGATSYNPAKMIGLGSSNMPSVGVNWLSGGKNHPDFGPGVNYTQIDPTYKGGFGAEWGYNSVVNGYYQNPSWQLNDPAESGMGWYGALLSELFGLRSPQESILSVTGDIPVQELDLSVDASDDFGEFQEAPYSAEDGTPLSQAELNAIRTAALTGRIPSESVRLDDTVNDQVVNSLRKAEQFKDSFDKALEALLGLDA